MEIGWSYPSDLWSVGCIIAELATGKLLFGTHGDTEHCALIERIILSGDRIPRNMNERMGASLRKKVFDLDGYVRIGNQSINYVRSCLSLEELIPNQIPINN